MASESGADKPNLQLVLRGPLYFALGLCAGVAIYFSLGFEPALAPLLVLGGSACALGLWSRRTVLPWPLRLGLILAVAASTGCLVAKVHTALKPAPVMTHTIGPVLLEGWVTSIDPGQNGDRLHLNVHAVAGFKKADIPDHVRLTHMLSLNVAPGRFVRCYAVLRPPPQASLPGDYQFNRQAFFEGLGAVGYVMGRCRGGSLGTQKGGLARAELWIGSVRRRLAEHVHEVVGKQAGGFAAALTSGDRSFMPQADVEALRNSGLAHLLAISGLHLGIVATLVFFAVKRALSAWEWLALRYPVQKPAAVAALLATGAYMILSGASISTQRAFIMASVVFVAVLLDRAPLSLRSFAIAMMAVILIQPASVMTPGFQMSFAATGALITAYEVWNRHEAEQGRTGRRGIGFVLKSLVVTSTVGALATAPFALYHFDRVAPLGLVANFLAMPIVTFVSAPAAGLALVAAPFGLSDIFLKVFGWSLERVLDIAYWAAGPEDRGLSFGEAMPAAVLILLTIGLSATCLLPSVRQKLVGTSALLGVSILVWKASPTLLVHWSASGDLFVRGPEAVMRIELAEGEGLSPLRFSELDIARACEDGCRINSLGKGTVVAGEADWVERACRGRQPVILAASLTSTSLKCQAETIDLDWETTRQAGGVTILRRIDGTLLRRVPQCGHRPWAPCLDGRRPPDQS
ncbi:ComEC/Rec2 family competence protein [Henriciella aquimarina]|uniref:ComEC/Rec2 family competence protein n=1 Tax=Henriciella aquimarina TaxID=545261 RepID=UPI0013020A24|nr:ComEC/Rec2 family competence protein [Henriciella aquimarina]